MTDEAPIIKRMPRAASWTVMRHLKKRWKRTARRWARPYPSTGCTLGTIALLLATTCYFLWSHTSPSSLGEYYQSTMLHYAVNTDKSESSSKQILAADDRPHTSAAESRNENRVLFNEQNGPLHPTNVSEDSHGGSTFVPKACLAMIMKNEGPILPRLFESVQGFVSEYCVVDTGSTDDTMDVLRSIDMPGLLVEEAFVDFATTRNFLLDTCRKQTTCDYLVLLDADMVLEVSPEWDWAKLDGKDVYNLIQVSSVEYENVRIIKRTADKIRVVGATHEYYDVPPEYSKGLLPKRLVYIDDVGDGKAKGDKFERDERLLRRELEKEPDNVRTVFYLANTLKDQGKYAEAIPFYERRVAMGGWFAEADYSLYMLSACYLELGDLDTARMYAEKAAFNGAAQRAEPLYFLALHLHRHGQYELAWHYATLASTIPKPHVSRALFIATDIYDYWVAYEQASLCSHVFAMEPQACSNKMTQFLENPHAPENLRQYIRSNQQVLG